MSVRGHFQTSACVAGMAASPPIGDILDAGVRFNCVQSDLLAIRWKVDSLSADFILPGAEGHALRIRFNGPAIVRLLDEMPLSTEEGTKNQGLISRHFAYRVENSTFADKQSWAWKTACHPVSHYEFITGAGCMDVLSNAEPRKTLLQWPQCRRHSRRSRGHASETVRSNNDAGGKVPQQQYEGKPSG
jgi:hypothetical protein